MVNLFTAFVSESCRTKSPCLREQSKCTSCFASQFTSARVWIPEGRFGMSLLCKETSCIV